MGFYRSITVDHTKCGSADSTDFPFPFFGTFSYLATVANGGKVTSSSGFDIIFCTNPATPLATLLPFERAGWDASTGACEFHVTISTLSHTADTVIYIYYGDSAITSDQQNASGTWDSGFFGVYHFPFTGSTITTSNVTDSTSNANLMTSTHGSPLLVAGIVGQAFGSNGGSDVEVPGATTRPVGAPIGTASRTVEMWFKQAATAAHDQELGGIGDNGGSGGPRWAVFIFDATHIGIEIGGSSSKVAFTQDTNWHYVVAALPSGQTNLSGAVMYLDGAQVTLSGLSGTGAIGLNRGTWVGTIPAAPGVDDFLGSIDEFRCSTSDRTSNSGAYVVATYNAINGPNSFSTIGAQQSTGGGTLLINPGMSGGMRPLLNGGMNG